MNEPSEIKPNPVDQTHELFEWLCNYRKLHKLQVPESSSGNIHIAHIAQLIIVNLDKWYCVKSNGMVWCGVCRQCAKEALKDLCRWLHHGGEVAVCIIVVYCCLALNCSTVLLFCDFAFVSTSMSKLVAVRMNRCMKTSLNRNRLQQQPVTSRKSWLKHFVPQK